MNNYKKSIYIFKYPKDKKEMEKIINLFNNSIQINKALALLKYTNHINKIENKEETFLYINTQQDKPLYYLGYSDNIEHLII